MDKVPTKSTVIVSKKATLWWFLITQCCFFNFLVAQNQKKEWLVLVYMAADNDLASFATKNIEQMQQVSSTDSMHLVILVTSNTQNKKATDIYHIKNGTLITQNTQSNTQQTDTGDPQTLIDFCVHAIKEFPSEHRALIFWNHGTGILHPTIQNKTSCLNLFSLNKYRHQKKYQKSNTHALPIATRNVTQKAVCFDDTSHNFLTEYDILEALSAIKEVTITKPFDLIGFDACLMSMIEIATTVEPFTDYVVASQEVELGWGWQYECVLKPFSLGTLKPKTFGKHIVNCYAKMYDFLDDYSLSLIDTKQAIALKNNIDLVAQISSSLLHTSNKATFKKLLHLSRNKHFCTHFEEPSFIDLAHFYQNIMSHVYEYTAQDQTDALLWERLIDAVKDGLNIVKNQVVIANKTGKKAPYAQGISIYFPEYAVHPSYIDAVFSQTTAWLSFLNLYLKTE